VCRKVKRAGAVTEAEQNELHKAKFIAKEREQLTVDTPLRFNSGLIQLVLDGITSNGITSDGITLT
jgi:hypothetical protein